MQGVGSGKVLQSGPNDNVFINFDVRMKLDSIKALSLTLSRITAARVLLPSLSTISTPLR